MIEINLNDTVKVRLNAHGRRIVQEAHEAFLAAIPPAAKARFRPVREVNEDVNGWSTWQFWQLMKEFGPHIALGAEMPFCDGMVRVQRDKRETTE